MKKIFLFAILLVGIFISSFCCASFAQESSDTGSSNWFLTAPDKYPIQIRPGIKALEHRERYYADVFIPLLGTKDAFFFLNPKLTLTYDNEITAKEQNAGIGYRTLIFDDTAILGGNVFYDTRKTENNVRHHQLGAGLEFLSKWVDVRTNCYFPISGKKHIKDDITYGFTSSALTRYTTPTYEDPLEGIDYEAGLLVPFLSDVLETRCFIGGYHYFSNHTKDINGIRGRIEVSPVPACTFNLEIADDNISKMDVYVGGYISIPFTLGKGKDPYGKWVKSLGFAKGPRPIKERMTDMVIRDLDIIASETELTETSSKEHDLVYVDDSNTTGTEDGSLASPYNTIKEGITYVTGDKWIYIQPGTYSETAAETIIVSDGITLWGAGYDGGFTGITAGAAPVIDGGASSVPILTLNGNNTIMGCTIQNTNAAHGITVAASITGGITIRNNTIKDLVGDSDAISMGNDSFENNISNITITDNTISNFGASGININPQNAVDFTNITISGNTITGVAGSNGIALASYGGGAISSVNISGTLLQITGTREASYYLQEL